MSISAIVFLFYLCGLVMAPMVFDDMWSDDLPKRFLVISIMTVLWPLCAVLWMLLLLLVLVSAVKKPLRKWRK